MPHPGCSQRPSDSGRGPSKPRGGRRGKGQGAWRGLIHMQGTARRGGRQERTKAVPPPAAPCQAHPARSPGGPRCGPPCVCSAGRGCSVPRASGRRQPPSDPAHPISSGDLRATAPFSESPGQLRWPRLLERGWTAQSLRQRPEFYLVHGARTRTYSQASADGTCPSQLRGRLGGGEGGVVGQNSFQDSQ